MPVSTQIKVPAQVKGAVGGGSSAFSSITGWPGSSSDVIKGDGSYGAVSATNTYAGCQASRTSTQSHTSGNTTIIECNANNKISNATIHSTSSSKGSFVADSTGVWESKICLLVNFSGSPAATLYVRKNGTNQFSWPFTIIGGTNMQSNAYWELDLTSGDVLDWTFEAAANGDFIAGTSISFSKKGT